jgi:phenylacetate-CoA ligase
MTSVEGVEAYRFIVDRINHRDLLRCELVTEPGVDPEVVARDVRSSVRSGLRFDVEVVPVAEPTAADGPIVDSRSWD